jgi:hypothetical protein
MDTVKFATANFKYILKERSFLTGYEAISLQKRNAHHEVGVCVFVCLCIAKIGPRPPGFDVDSSHTIKTYTPGRNALNEWSVHRKGRYVHNM